MESAPAVNAINDYFLSVWSVALVKVAIAVVVVLGSSLVFFCLSKAVELVGGRISSTKLVSIFAAFGFLALVTGAATGMSRAAAISEVVPAILGLLGGICIFQLTKKEIPIAEPAVAVASFSIFLLLGVLVGSNERRDRELFLAKLPYDLGELERRANVEFQIRNYRENLGLDPAAIEIAISD